MPCWLSDGAEEDLACVVKARNKLEKRRHELLPHLPAGLGTHQKKKARMSNKAQMFFSSQMCTVGLLVFLSF